MKENILNANTALGIELGSTRIKAVLIGPDNSPVASGTHDWENRLENGIWTYSLEDVWQGLQGCYADLCANIQEKYGVALTRVGQLGISGMMHGYIALDAEGRLMVPFRTWRNTTTGQAAAELSEEFGFNIPQRWSIAHLYQAVLNGEEHVAKIDKLFTLAGYVHWRLTGQRVLGIGEASGMFPIDSAAADYNAAMTECFDGLVAKRKFSWKLRDILPKVLLAGETAGSLTAEGAALLDPTGSLQAGIPLCPPEGDAGTGMVATNSVLEKTGNVSAGTSSFAMLVMEKELSKVYEEIDMVTTPTGKPVAMVHCNNCTGDLDAWVELFGEVVKASGGEISKPKLYDMLYGKALEGSPDGGGLLAYNYFSGEPITGISEGRPLFVRMPNSKMTLANFMRTQMWSILGTLKIGMDILTGQEQVEVAQLLGHGGFFKTRLVGQKMMAAAFNVPVAVMESAGEGGAWGIALLASYAKNRQPGETLEDFLSQKVFANIEGSVQHPDSQDVQGFENYMKLYEKGLDIERAAVTKLKSSDMEEQ